ncbi:uncharacterized protein LOC111805575 [Cucurbita pepo subsp. pepo]|uniref:uncharacterized protein LOC111805575 n=1 Tax=Cucurbita pepo subsp. pepo TaxID=3664 RepID=UPI000C9D419B|nr:uncharacterized protein LOC111805575 [Cucurbita pepo subsp. pepo]
MVTKSGVSKRSQLIRNERRNSIGHLFVLFYKDFCEIEISILIWLVKQDFLNVFTLTFSCLPSDLEGAVRQSGEAAGLFVSSGGLRAIVELLIPQLQFLDDEGAQAELWELSRVFLESVIEETKCEKVKAVFPDAGAAALLEYRWKDASFKISSLSDRKPVDTADEIVVMVVPDYQMLENVEKIAAALSDDPPRPLIMWNPRLISEDVGVGFNVRKLRRYFLSTFTTVYSMRPLPSGAVFRAYPGLWKVFFDDKDRPGRYLLAKELISRPDAGDLEVSYLRK